MRMNKSLCMFVYVKLMVFYVNIITFVAELCGQAFSTRALYSEGTGFKSWPRDRLSWKFFVLFICSFSEMLAYKEAKEAARHATLIRGILVEM